MFPGCHPCSGSPSLLRFDFEFARGSSFVHLDALPVHALRQVIIIIIDSILMLIILIVIFIVIIIIILNIIIIIVFIVFIINLLIIIKAEVGLEQSTSCS